MVRLNHPKSRIAGDIRIIRRIARTLLVVTAVFWFVFALLSGAEAYGGGLRGIILNSPNAIPWVILAACVYVVFRWEAIGSLVLIGMGAFLGWFVIEDRALPLFLVIVLPILGSGIALLYCSVQSRYTGCNI